MPTIITDENFNEILKHPLVLIYCWTKWCKPCHLIAPVIDELAEELSEEVLIGKLDIDKNRNTAFKFSIRTVPTFLIFKNGKLVDEFHGRKKEILDHLKPHIDSE